MSTSWLRRAAGRPLSLLLQAAGRAYVPGWTLADALRLAERLAAGGQACTLGYFNAAHDTVAAVAAECEAIVDAAAQLAPPGYLSLKAPAFGFDPRAMAPVLALARERAMPVHFDSHDIASADATLHCVEQAVAQGNATGLTLPARWPRSRADAERAIALGLRVRLVKGEWPDPAAPGTDPRAGLLALAGQLAGRAAEVAGPPTTRRWRARRCSAWGPPARAASSSCSTACLAARCWRSRANSACRCGCTSPTASRGARTRCAVWARTRASPGGCCTTPPQDFGSTGGGADASRNARRQPAAYGRTRRSHLRAGKRLAAWIASARATSVS
ncbi:MAG: hypothetical protein JNL87_17255 [Burkholderiaceae bacterium]|nr:hypothetical protein [Burkholderiaceae bacterium]